ncbi:MAG: hypothetical protein WC346_09250 [Methanogenium sp.]|jgi:hypothetical protein
MVKRKVEEYDDEEENIEEEFAEMEREEKESIPIKRPLNQVQRRPKQQEVPTERYQAIYQPEKIAIVDTITKEIIVEGLPSLPNAVLEAYKMNMLDRIGIVSGA